MLQISFSAVTLQANRRSWPPSLEPRRLLHRPDVIDPVIAPPQRPRHPPSGAGVVLAERAAPRPAVGGAVVAVEVLQVQVRGADLGRRLGP